VSSLDSLYQELILDHARHPLGKGLKADFDGESFQVNPTCGDQIRLRLSVDADQGIISSVSWDGQGCSISQASASIMKQLIDGLTTAQALELQDLFAELMHSRGRGIAPGKADQLGDAMALEGTSLYPMRVKCALLSWMALRDALTKALAGDSSPARAPEGI
jgi:nitrogen fixation NifU-like protein